MRAHVLCLVGPVRLPLQGIYLVHRHDADSTWRHQAVIGFRWRFPEGTALALAPVAVAILPAEVALCRNGKAQEGTTFAP